MFVFVSEGELRETFLFCLFFQFVDVEKIVLKFLNLFVRQINEWTNKDQRYYSSHTFFYYQKTVVDVFVC